MSALTLTAVAIGTGAGACLRYVTDRLVTPRVEHQFPTATFIVNVIGSFILGVIAGLVTHHDVSNNVRLLIGTGLCGGLTTFSTFGYETLRLVESKNRGLAGFYVFVSVAAGLAAAAAGLAIAG